jgi:membrane protein implicated in regulation of membrane protease activity
MFESAVAAQPREVQRADTIKDLQARIRRMQRNRLDTRELPTNPALAGLLPGGALAAGSAYSVAGSTTLALGMLQGPSAAGAWCAVVGLPDLGVESAAGLGIDLDRLVLVPHPGEQWLAVVSALIDVVSVVLVHPPAGRLGSVSEGTASRLAARLRQREAVLVSLGDWPRADARLTVSDSSWAGLGSGFGHLTGRQVTVRATSPSGRPVSRRLWLPGPEQRIEAVENRAVEGRALQSVAG